MHIDFAIIVAACIVICVSITAAAYGMLNRKTTLRYMRTRCTLASELMMLHIPDSSKPTVAVLNGRTIHVKLGCVYFFTYGKLPSGEYIQRLANELSRIGYTCRNGVRLRISMDTVTYPEVESIYDGIHISVRVPLNIEPPALAAFIFHLTK